MRSKSSRNSNRCPPNCPCCMAGMGKSGGPRRGRPRKDWFARNLVYYRPLILAFAALLLSTYLYVAKRQYDFMWAPPATCEAPVPASVDLEELGQKMHTAFIDSERGMGIVESVLVIDDGEEFTKKIALLLEGIAILHQTSNAYIALYDELGVATLKRVPRHYEYRRKLSRAEYYQGLGKMSAGGPADAVDSFYRCYVQYNDLIRDFYEDGNIVMAVEIAKEMALVVLDSCRAQLHIPGRTKVANEMWERYVTLLYFIDTHENLTNDSFSPRGGKRLGHELKNYVKMSLAGSRAARVTKDAMIDNETMTMDELVAKYARTYDAGNKEGISAPGKLRLASLLLCAAFYERLIGLFEDSQESFDLAMDFYDDYLMEGESPMMYVGIPGGYDFPPVVTVFFKDHSRRLVRQSLGEMMRMESEHSSLEEEGNADAAMPWSKDL